MGKTWNKFSGNAKRSTKHLPYGAKYGDTMPVITTDRGSKMEGSAIPINKRAQRSKNKFNLRDIDFD